MRSRRKGKLLTACVALALVVATLITIQRCNATRFGVEPAMSGAGGDRAEAPPPDPAALARYIELESHRGDADLVAGNDVELLINGDETYRSMLDAIAAARNTVHLETYIIQDDKVGNRFADALIRRSKEGVTVRVIYDGYGSTDNEAFWQRLRDAGVETRAFNPPDPTENADIADYEQRDHRKILVVDGRVGFTGGVNFYDAYAQGSSRRTDSGLASRWPWSEPKPARRKWRDTHVRIEGPAVRELQRLFVGHWARVAKKIDGSGLYPELPAEGGQRVRIESGVGGNARPSETYATYMDVFAEARQRIWITQAYFVPNESFIDALAGAARRGVDVKIIVPGVTDVSLILYASRRLYGELLEAGAQIFEYQDGVLHAKTAVVDGVWSIVGSSNLDSLSFIHNDEDDAVILGRPFALEMERVFRDDLGHTRQVTLAAWRDRPLGYRILGRAAGLLRPWL